MVIIYYILCYVMWSNALLNLIKLSSAVFTQRSHSKKTRIISTVATVFNTFCRPIVGRRQNGFNRQFDDLCLSAGDCFYQLSCHLYNAQSSSSFRPTAITCIRLCDSFNETVFYSAEGLHSEVGITIWWSHVVVSYEDVPITKGKYRIICRLQYSSLIPFYRLTVIHDTPC